MKLKSLLIGSAAVMAVSTGGAKAADAIVMAEPEPMEYVRICDVYGTGYYYIPGTETCLKIGGYYRVDVSYHAATTENTTVAYQQIDANGNPVGFTRTVNITRTNPAGYTTLARFAPTFDVRSETEWGTLRGFAEVEITYGWTAATMPSGLILATTSPALTGTLGGSYESGANLNHGFIEVIGGSGTFRIGKGDLPWARFLGYGAPGFVSGGSYAFANPTGYGNGVEASYTFVGSNGFSGIIALVDNPANTSWSTNVEGGVNWAQGWGSIGAIAGYDAVTNTWGAKGALRFNAPNGAFQTGLMAFYTSGAGDYQVSANQTNWSVLAYARVQATQNVNFGVWAQWFDTNVWSFRGNLNITPVENLLIRPEIGYTTAGGGSWSGVLRFQRDIP